MQEVGLTQAALGREIGVSQQAIHKLLIGTTRETGKIARIARALQTTAAYLEGETDDPDCDSPEWSLSHDEQEWLTLLRQLAPTDRAAVMQLTRTIAGSAISPMVNARSQDWKGAGD